MRRSFRNRSRRSGATSRLVVTWRLRCTGRRSEGGHSRRHGSPRMLVQHPARIYSPETRRTITRRRVAPSREGRQTSHEKLCDQYFCPDTRCRSYVFPQVMRGAHIPSPGSRRCEHIKRRQGRSLPWSRQLLTGDTGRLVRQRQSPSVGADASDAPGMLPLATLPGDNTHIHGAPLRGPAGRPYRGIHSRKHAKALSRNSVWRRCHSPGHRVEAGRLSSNTWKRLERLSSAWKQAKQDGASEEPPAAEPDPRVVTNPTRRSRTPLTPDEVDEIRTARSNGERAMSIARRFEVSRMTVWEKTRERLT